MELLLSDSDKWMFEPDTNGRWIWVRRSPAGEPLTASRANYETLEECVTDARSRGYTGPTPRTP